MNGALLMRWLTWLCAAVALVAIVTFALGSWELFLFALGVGAVVTFVVNLVKTRLGSNRRQTP